MHNSGYILDFRVSHCKVAGNYSARTRVRLTKRLEDNREVKQKQIQNANVAQTVMKMMILTLQRLRY